MHSTMEWRRYASFGTEITAMEKSTAVSEILSGIVSRWGYPINAVIGARVRSLPLRELPQDTGGSEDLDLVFELKGQDFWEVIVRDHAGFPTYGGWLVRGDGVSLGATDPCGYKTLSTFDHDGNRVLHRHHRNMGYCPVDTATLPEEAVLRLRQQGL